MIVPKRLGHIWIGPNPAPKEWMQTWVDKHPGWEYTLYDNEFLQNGTFRTAPQIKEYMERGSYAGAADLLRYEILFERGGYLAGADSICFKPIDELLSDSSALYTIYENEFLRGKLVAPITASVPRHPFINEILNRLSAIPPDRLDLPWRQTGNLFIAELIEELDPEITIWPSHFLIPVHFEGRVYQGPGKVYAYQMFGSTVGAYDKGSFLRRRSERKKSRKAAEIYKRLHAERLASQAAAWEQMARSEPATDGSDQNSQR